ncbi:MAG: DUF2306 domain-containing protein [Bryobacteraceae bacterium]|jgi:uncharacterized membrane protein
MKSESIQTLGVHNTPRDRLVWTALLILCAIGAAAVMRRILELRTTALASSSEFAGLDAHFAAKTGIILLHIVPSLLFVLLVPLQFVPSLRRRHPRLHRWTGRVIMGLSIVLGTSALWLSVHPVGGLAEGTATIFFGCFFLLSLAKAWWHIRNGRVELHREWVTRMVAIALGVATTRPIMGVFFATRMLTGLTPQQFFGPAMWLGFVSTYLAGEAWINYSRPPTAHGTNNAIYLSQSVK